MHAQLNYMEFVINIQCYCYVVFQQYKCMCITYFIIFVGNAFSFGLSVSQLAIVHRAHSIGNIKNINRNKINKYTYVNL